MRDFAQIKLSIWNDDDFRDLTPRAQHLYFMMLSHPTLNYAGVGEWRPARFAAMCKGWTKAGVTQAALELVEAFFIVVDEATEEYLVRSFVRNDPLMKRGNMGVAMARAFSTVASTGIRGVIVSELNVLRKRDPKLAGFGSDEVQTVMCKKRLDVRDFPCGKPQVLLLDDHLTDHHDDHLSVMQSTMQSGEVIDEVSGIDEGQLSVMQSGEVINKVIDTTATTTTPLQQVVVDNSNHKGSAGEGSSSPSSFVPYGSLDDPRCARHRDLPKDQVPACRDCGKAREVWQQRADDAKAEKRRVIDECGWCDERGIAELHDADGRPVAVKCDHTHPPQPPPPPEPFKPLRTKKKPPPW